MRAWVRSAAATLGASLLVLAVVELGLRLLDVQPAPWPTLRNTVPRDGIVVDPLLGPGPRPGWSGAWFEGYRVEVDDRGFRTSGLPLPAAPRARVAFMGDSCTFGFGVDSEETFLGRLDSLQRRDGREAALDLINGGYPGDSAVVGRFKLRDRVLPLQPDLVVLGYSAHNSFRLSLAAHVDGFRSYELRKLALRSRLLHIGMAAYQNAVSPPGLGANPRSRELIARRELSELHRVARPSEFEAALRASVRDARAAGASVAVLVFPRAIQVERPRGDRFLRPGFERRAPEGAPPTQTEMAMIELSCLEHDRPDVLDALYREGPAWRPLAPRDPRTRERLQRGAQAWVRGDLDRAARTFREAVSSDPESPLALYDLGVTEIARGNRAEGLALLDQADVLACSAFLRYQVLLWRLALDLDLPVLDLVLLFQAHLGEELFLDAAHPNARGHRLIAQALEPVLSDWLGAGASPGQ